MESAGHERWASLVEGTWRVPGGIAADVAVSSEPQNTAEPGWEPITSHLPETGGRSSVFDFSTFHLLTLLLLPSAPGGPSGAFSTSHNQGLTTQGLIPGRKEGAAAQVDDCRRPCRSCWVGLGFGSCCFWDFNRECKGVE